MTEVFIKNSDIINSITLAADTPVYANKGDKMDYSGNNNFNNVLDKTISQQNESKPENIQQAGINGDELNDFKKNLTQETQEVNIEKSLDLTLASDITQIISQLKAAISVTDTLNESIEEVPVTDLMQNNEENEANEADESGIKNTADTADTLDITDIASTAVPPIFEQILTLVNDKSEDTNISSDSETYEIQESDTSEQDITEYKNNNFLIKPKETTEPQNDKEAKDIKSEIDKAMLEELNIETLSSETETSDKDFMAQKQTPEEISLKIMLNHDTDTKFEVTTEKPVTNPSVKQADITPEKIIEQLTKHFDSLKSSSKLNMVLNPESLGKVNLQIINSKAGLSAQFTVTTNDARELLMKGIDGLKESLLAHGVNVDNISVKVSETEEPYNPDWTEQQDSEGENSQQGRRKHEEKEKGLFEKTMAQSLDESNGKV